MTERPMNVRPAEERDEENLFAILCMAYKENAPYKINPNKVRLMISAASRDKDVIIGVIDAPDGSGRIAATVGAMFSQWWYTDDWHIEDCWNYVHPEYRKSTFAKDLLNYSKWIAEKMSMPLHVGILTAERMESKVRFFARQMPQVGASFVYNMEAASGPIAEAVHG